MCKPGPGPRADLPAIGPETVMNAHAAGLSGIAIEAGRSLVLEREQLVSEADRLGLFVTGIESSIWSRRNDGTSKLAVIAGEPSGDMLGADLVRQIGGPDRRKTRIDRRRWRASDADQG
jgi:hypothetical protein